ncbi:MAG: DUF6580 family putative transport protein [Bacteroidia bacterium]
MNKYLTPRNIFIASALLIAIVGRLIPHAPNFTPVAAMALFGGATLNNKRLAYILPIIAMFLSDLIIGFHNTMWAVYLAFIATVYIGTKINNNIKPLSVITASIASSSLFFIVTNFAVWLGSTFYPQNIYGLIECYIAAIPFFNNGLVGDLFYSGILFTVFTLAGQRFPQLAK